MLLHRLVVTTASAALALALAAGLTSAAATPSRAPTPVDHLDALEPGSLALGDGASGAWDVGPVTVVLDPVDGLSVTSHDRTVWASEPGHAFVVGGRGSLAWEEHRGYFWPTVTYDDRLVDQTVETVEAGEAGVVLAGTLAGDPGDQEATWTLTVAPRPAGGASMSVVTDATSPLSSVALVSGRSDHAAVHGFGEQFTDFDLDGRLIPVVVREQGVGRGEQPVTQLADLTNHGAGGTEAMTYAAWPSFVTEDLRGVRLSVDDPLSSSFAVADTRDPGAVALELWASSLTAELSAADSPTALVAAQQAGDRRPRLARWATSGAIIGLQGGTAEVRRELGRLQRAGAEISGVWIQDWSGKRTTSFGDRLWWTWQLDRERYPGWSRLVRDLARQGIRTTTYVNTFLVDAAPKGDPSIRNLLAEADDRGYLVEDADGAPYLLDQGEFDASLVDLTDPAARSWYADVIAEEVLADGVQGFMADFGEGLPFDAELADGTAAALHNRWPSLWAQTVRLACRRAEQPRCVTWFRSGGLGQAQDAALFWNGDQLVTFGAEDGLASALLGTLSAGVSGWPLQHSDVGGYTSVNVGVKNYLRTPELLERWAEYQAFGVVMRTHEGNKPDDNLQVYSNSYVAERFARMTRLFAALAPYRRTVVAQATRTGVPAVRPVWLVAPNSAAASSQREFFLGSHVLVAPVLTEGATRVRVDFPPGRWVHLLTGQTYAGGRSTLVGAPLGRPAAFVRADDPWRERLRAAVERVGQDREGSTAQ